MRIERELITNPILKSDFGDSDPLASAPRYETHPIRWVDGVQRGQDRLLRRESDAAF